MSGAGSRRAGGRGGIFAIHATEAPQGKVTSCERHGPAYLLDAGNDRRRGEMTTKRRHFERNANVLMDSALIVYRRFLNTRQPWQRAQHQVAAATTSMDPPGVTGNSSMRRQSVGIDMAGLWQLRCSARHRPAALSPVVPVGTESFAGRHDD